MAKAGSTMLDLSVTSQFTIQRLCRMILVLIQQMKKLLRTIIELCSLIFIK